MRSPLIVVGEPGVKIGLQLFDGAIDLFAERHPVELVEQGAVETLANSVGLRAFGLGAAVIDVFDGEVKLVFMALGAAKLVPRSVSIRSNRMPCSS